MNAHEHKLFRSFRHAFRGLYVVAKTELSFRVQLFVGSLVLILLIVLPLLLWQRIILILLIAAVLILEVINSIFERMVDSFKPRLNPMVGEIKDIMAAAVLLASIVSAVIGILIFSPYLF